MIGLGRTNYDVFIYPAPSRESVGYFMMKMIRATERIGFGGDITEHGKKLEEMGALTYTKLIRPPENIKAEIDRYVYFTEQVTGKKIDVEFPTIDIKKLSDCKALELLKVNDLENKKYAIMFPGAGAPYRIWPPEKSAQIVNYIRNKGMTVVMCGGDKEKALVRDIMSLANKNQQDDGQNVIADLSGKTDLATLAHLLAKSQFYFGSDTGILHLAVAVGTPAVATVGSGGLDRFFPYGDLKKNRVVCDRTHSFVRSYTPGDWSDAHFLKPNEIHPSIKNITTEDAEKEVDYMIDYTS
jgi:ADP-heptose:LPS heptosyltransferase